MNCEEVRTRLLHYQQGRLPMAAQGGVRAHLDGCPDCAHVESAEGELTRVLERSLPQYPASLGLKRRLAAQWPAAAAERSRLSRWRNNVLDVRPGRARWNGCAPDTFAPATDGFFQSRLADRRAGGSSSMNRTVDQDGVGAGSKQLPMSKRLALERAPGKNPAWLAVPLVIIALITLTVGVVARRTVRVPYETPFFHPFFTDTLQMKVWLVTAAVMLACGQLMTAARIYEWLQFPPKGGFYQAVHRWSGRAAILLTLPVAYHCVFMLGFETHSPRVLIHSLLGSALYGTVVAKILIVRSSRFAPWVLPVAGGLLFSILLGLWLTSALWFVTAGASSS